MPPLRGEGSALPPANKSVGLPPRPFLYTIDQLAVLLDLSEKTVLQNYVYFEGRSIGTRRMNLISARNIAPPDKPAEWRVPEREFIRWMKTKGFKYYERSSFTD
jgi:hypothetical protein